MADHDMQESGNYQRMMGEVEDIIRSISSEQLDLDDMVEKVERGYTLIKSMRERLADAKGKIEQLQATFDDGTQTPAAGDAPPAPQDSRKN